MADFVYKLVKDIYSVRTVTVDQYGQVMRDVPAIIHGNYASSQEAQEARKEIAYRDPHNWRWIPNKVRHGYERVDIVYLSETIIAGSLAEVVAHAMRLKDK